MNGGKESFTLLNSLVILDVYVFPYVRVIITTDKETSKAKCLSSIPENKHLLYYFTNLPEPFFLFISVRKSVLLVKLMILYISVSNKYINRCDF